MSNPNPWHDACPVDAVNANQGVEFMIDDTPGFVIAHKDSYHAYVNRCPHLGIELNWMPGRFLDSDHCFIQCATHGALFTLDQGLCVAGPCQGDALTPLETRVKDAQLQVRLPG